jgi:hypothetical protein
MTILSLCGVGSLHSPSRRTPGRRREIQNGKPALIENQFGTLKTLLHLGSLEPRALRLVTAAGNVAVVVDNLEPRSLVRRLRDRKGRRISWDSSARGWASPRARAPRRRRRIVAGCRPTSQGSARGIVFNPARSCSKADARSWREVSDDGRPWLSLDATARQWRPSGRRFRLTRRRACGSGASPRILTRSSRRQFQARSSSACRPSEMSGENR